MSEKSWRTAKDYQLQQASRIRIKQKDLCVIYNKICLLRASCTAVSQVVEEEHFTEETADAGNLQGRGEKIGLSWIRDCFRKQASVIYAIVA